MNLTKEEAREAYDTAMSYKDREPSFSQAEGDELWNVLAALEVGTDTVWNSKDFESFWKEHGS